MPSKYTPELGRKQAARLRARRAAARMALTSRTVRTSESLDAKALEWLVARGFREVPKNDTRTEGS